jgi:predicted GIY-YIG superfamily endonuclease
MYTVYILYSQSYHKHYTGYSSDFEEIKNPADFEPAGF